LSIFLFIILLTRVSLASKQLSNNFSPEGIHCKADFWEHTLKAGPWVMEIIRHGYKVPFISEPDQDVLPNNASVRDNMEVTEGLIMELLQQGVLKMVSTKPHCVSPLGLVTRVINGEEKHRLIFDGSRLINQYVDPPTVKLAFLQKALLKIHRNE